MDFHQLEYVIAIAEEKSISKAAKKLYISQPSLSQYIIRLENNLGVKLFDRSTNSLTLTFAGEKYLQTARDILDLNRRLKRELSDIAGFRKGRIVIGIPIQMGRYILPLTLPEFHELFPEIEIVVEEHVTIKLEQLLVNGKIDIAILNLPIQHDKILYEPVSDEKIFIVAPKNHPVCCKKFFIRQEKLYLKHLKNEKFILLKKGQRMRFITDEIFKSARFEPDILLEIMNLDTAHRIASAGMGFTFIPENVIFLLDLDASNCSNYFLIDGVTSTIVIAYRRGEYLTNAAREFINIVKRVIGRNHEKRMNKCEIYKKIYI